jgi:hypothetical protein
MQAPLSTGLFYGWMHCLCIHAQSTPKVNLGRQERQEAD